LGLVPPRKNQALQSSSTKSRPKGKKRKPARRESEGPLTSGGLKTKKTRNFNIELSTKSGKNKSVQATSLHLGAAQKGVHETSQTWAGKEPAFPKLCLLPSKKEGKEKGRGKLSQQKGKEKNIWANTRERVRMLVQGEGLRWKKVMQLMEARVQRLKGRVQEILPIL